MAEFTFSALLTISLFEEYAQNGLGIDAKGHFLHLDGFEKFRNLSLRLLCGCLFLFTFLSLGVLFLLVETLVRLRLGLQLGYLLLGTTAFFLLASLSVAN